MTMEQAQSAPDLDETAGVGLSPSPQAEIVFVIGNCQGGDIRNALARVSALQGEFEFHALPLHISSKPDERQADLLRRCTKVIAQDTSDFGKIDLRRFLPEDAEVFHVPFLSFRSFWPFDSLSYAPDKALLGRPPGGAVRFSDGVLGRLRDIIADHETRFQAYRSLDLPFEITNFARLFEIECDLLTRMDERYEMTLGQHIISGSRTRQMFYWVGHPTPEIYQLFIEHIWKLIKLPGVCPEIGGLDMWSSLQVPVHPLIGKRLDIDWISEKRIYHYMPIGRVTWEQYTRKYIETLG